eukprot:GAHX01000537.1.p1 GENE.GAHX01000537.1~~GAHX01000537.1.p1  ORF type:complete len:117 (+),score=29.25 GAHX01000537.1:29-379(+)
MTQNMNSVPSSEPAPATPDESNALKMADSFPDCTKELQSTLHTLSSSIESVYKELETGIMKTQQEIKKCESILQDHLQQLKKNIDELNEISQQEEFKNYNEDVDPEQEPAPSTINN